ncbi:hypothetical protein Tco_0749612 [Tanacetum coccineum]|uniref:Uncharacterized protein n=1 Tax=Tanacetum coccineum TaxID=301880 RepID=A0ABQ4Z1H5_9ASTR
MAVLLWLSAEDGLSAILLKLGIPLTLDFIQLICACNSWGRVKLFRADDWSLILVDDAGNPLRKVEFLGDYDSEDEVASVDNDMARSLASERVGFGTQSLLEQWRDSYGNIDYYEDQYDDDMYKGQDFLMRFKLYAIIWISEFEVARRNKFLFLLSSNFVYLPLRK